MGYIQSIKFNGDLREYSSNNIEKKDILDNLSKLNIFVGGNNSGKSRFLRSICNDSNLMYTLNSEKMFEYNKMVDNFNVDLKKFFNDDISKIGNIYPDSKLEKIEWLTEKDEYLRLFHKRMEDFKNLNENEERELKNGLNLVGQNIKIRNTNLKSIGEKYLNQFNEKGFDDFLKKRTFKRVYIPVLRGLRNIGSKDDLFKERTKKDYFKYDSEINIFTGQDLYNDVLNLLCGDYKDRVHLREFEEFLGKNFFDGESVSLIPKINSDVLHVKIGEEKQYAIHELGDGIQSIIILTFNLYANKGKDILFFIEEPELYLHPGLQRKLIEVFLSEEFNTYQYFITSHSNHLLDLSLDTNGISVYKFTKKVPFEGDEEKQAEFLIDNVKNDDISLLEELGVNNSSIFLSNCTIWVEGITDRLYIRKYLEVYKKEMAKNGKKIYLEDLNYSFLEYSGGNITHWDFLDDTEGELASMKHNRICTNMFLITDSDGYIDSKNGVKRERLEKLNDYFEEKFYCLKAKEIENILTPNIIKKSVRMLKDGRVTDPSKDRDFELFDKSNFNEEDYRSINIGEFIDEKINEQINIEKSKDSSFNYEKRKTFKDGNTIRYKVKFCKCAIENIKTLGDMSNEAKIMCEKIYEFIKRCN